MRDGELLSGTLRIADGWRKTILDWRISVSQGNLGAGPGFFPLEVDGKRRRELGIEAGSLAVEPYLVGKEKRTAFQAGLRARDVITAVDGESPDLTGRAFLTWFRLRFDPGDEVTLTLTDAPERTRTIRYTLER